MSRCFGRCRCGMNRWDSEILVSWEIIQADARALPLEDSSVDLICTSPPYWGLRSYRDGGEHYDGQIGSEGTPQGYVDGLVSMVDGEWRRVLKPEGSLWLNLGDKRAGSGGGNDNTGLGNARGEQSDAADSRGNPRRYRSGLDMAPRRSLLGLPWRVAIGLINAGWILLAPVVWEKTGMPESTPDRLRTTDQEMFFHFVLQPTGFYQAVDEIRQPHKEVSLKRAMPHRADPGRAYREQEMGAGPVQTLSVDQMNHPLGRMPGSVWKINYEPLHIPDEVLARLGIDGHHAAFPTELVRRPITGFSPQRVCDECGEGRRPIVERTPMEWEPSGRQDAADLPAGGVRPTSGKMPAAPTARIIGYGCACNGESIWATMPPSSPGVVLDPMCGTGTVPGVAHKLGRHGVGVDLSADYVRLAEWRIGSSNHFGKVTQRAWRDRQGGLFG